MAKADPQEAIFMLATGYWPSRCLHVAAELGVADVLGDEPEAAEALAERLGVQAQALGRILRALANVGVFEMQGATFAHNAASRLLRVDAHPSLRSLVRMMGLKMHWAAYGELDRAVRDGALPIQEAVGASMFERLGSHPEEARLFDEAMTGKSFGQIAATLATYDFGGFRTIADVGGGAGHLLRAVLDAYPEMSGALFDLPAVVARAAETPHPRIRYQGGDFFADPIPASDAYLLMMVLHDWSDAEAQLILAAVRRSAPERAKLLLVECVVGKVGAGFDFGAYLDIEMLAVTTGRERTRDDWETLLAAGGWRLARVVPTAAPGSIIEAEPA